MAIIYFGAGWKNVGSVAYAMEKCKLLEFI